MSTSERQILLTYVIFHNKRVYKRLLFLDVQHCAHGHVLGRLSLGNNVVSLLKNRLSGPSVLNIYLAVTVSRPASVISKVLQLCASDYVLCLFHQFSPPKHGV